MVINYIERVFWSLYTYFKNRPLVLIKNNITSQKERLLRRRRSGAAKEETNRLATTRSVVCDAALRCVTPCDAIKRCVRGLTLCDAALRFPTTARKNAST